ncbi:TPA: hypothetical protein ACX6SN_000819 [Photobacterium damselae]|uniref:hypothetical protein n=1 Tax=Photobacterium damselae TaxID=38293 RepID=UPI000D66156E|nr:hypothetical protein [Photobacterium damselae]AWK83528.1 hypothetical protein BST98_16000 [Photobacterium damselae]NVH47348.1 hypothetical protein [Photobacterium damselae subsp. damselae]
MLSKKTNNNSLTLTNKINFLVGLCLMLVIWGWFSFRFIESIIGIINEAHTIKTSLMLPFISVSTFGIIIWLVAALFTILKTNKKVDVVWSIEKKKLLGKTAILFFILGICTSLGNYVWTEKYLSSIGYKETIKITNLNIYKTYIK